MGRNGRYRNGKSFAGGKFKRFSKSKVNKSRQSILEYNYNFQCNFVYSKTNKKKESKEVTEQNKFRDRDRSSKFYSRTCFFPRIIGNKSDLNTFGEQYEQTVSVSKLIVVSLSSYAALKWR